MPASSVKKIALFGIGVPLSAASVFAAGGSESFSWFEPSFYIKICTVYLVILSIILLAKKEWPEGQKKILFGMIAVPIMLATLYLGGHTVYENMISVTKGPVHWHFDYQVWACGERLDLIDPKFPSNKIGTPLLHEHNDDRAHVEGVVMQYEDVNLGSFFRTVGGELTDDTFTYVTNDGTKSFRNGDQCPEGSAGNLKVYVNGAQIENAAEYLYAQETLVPPGDCIIIEFSEDTSESTEKLCESWEANEWNYDNFEELRNK